MAVKPLPRPVSEELLAALRGLEAARAPLPKPLAFAEMLGGRWDRGRVAGTLRYLAERRDIAIWYGGHGGRNRYTGQCAVRLRGSAVILRTAAAPAWPDFPWQDVA